jgi:alpha-1,3-glucosyltransferase
VTPNHDRLVNLCFPTIVHPLAVHFPMADLYPSIAQCAVVATALKVLLFPA